MICVVCGKDFAPHTWRQLTCSLDCRTVMKRIKSLARNKAYYQTNAERRKMQHREYRLANIETVREKDAAYQRERRAAARKAALDPGGEK